MEDKQKDLLREMRRHLTDGERLCSHHMTRPNLYDALEPGGWDEIRKAVTAWEIRTGCDLYAKFCTALAAQRGEETNHDQTA